MIFGLIDAILTTCIGVAYVTLEWLDRDRIEVDDDYLA